MKYTLTLLVLVAAFFVKANPPKQEYYEIRIYQLGSADQETRMDAYLKDAFMPALHRAGISKIGVFKPVGNDTAAVRKIYLLIPYKSLSDIEGISGKLEKDNAYNTAGADYMNSAHDNPAYARFSKIILKAFSGHPAITEAKLTGPQNERVYELRSYESASEKLFRKKVDMFVKGNEIAIFDNLKFNHIFYGEVLAGTAMPNLMYMTSFENKQSRDEHWKAFGEHPDWKKLSADKQYDNTVSHIDITFLNPVEYSDL
ncbi:MAG TPA: NIPSNAP family protein [Flavitalea sp.]|nr:NIPSNAP family protein [Flavitalea sp.]